MIPDELIKKAQSSFPCFGHFSRMHCLNIGFLTSRRDQNGILQCKHCPLENDCIKVTRQYAENCDPYLQGKIDKPRQWLKELDNRGKIEVDEHDRKQATDEAKERAAKENTSGRVNPRFTANRPPLPRLSIGER